MLQVRLVLVVLCKPPLEVGRQRGRVAEGQGRPRGFPWRGMLVVAGVEQVRRLTGQKPPLPSSLRHPPTHRPHPAATTQPVQHPADARRISCPQNGRQVRDAGQRHQPRYPEQTPLLITQ